MLSSHPQYLKGEMLAYEQDYLPAASRVINNFADCLCKFVGLWQDWQKRRGKGTLAEVSGKWMLCPWKEEEEEGLD